ncbi:hypothetical protein FPQ18DRAFT_408689 [Pyronema domesticum]|nr:hypothetical protein FPQ18DRAFT_408689 [Pyronema domesticum]
MKEIIERGQQGDSQEEGDCRERLENNSQGPSKKRKIMASPVTLVEDKLPPPSHLSGSFKIRGILKNPHSNGKKTQKRAIIDTSMSMARVYVKDDWTSYDRTVGNRNEWTSYDVPLDHAVHAQTPWVNARSGVDKGQFKRGYRRFTVEEAGGKVAINEDMKFDTRPKYGFGDLPDGDYYDDDGYRIIPRGLIPRTVYTKYDGLLDKRLQHPLEYGEFRSRYLPRKSSAPPSTSMPTTAYHPPTPIIGPSATVSQPAANHWIMPRPHTPHQCPIVRARDDTPAPPDRSNPWMPPRPSTPIYPTIRLGAPELEEIPGRTATPASFIHCPERPLYTSLGVGTPYPQPRPAPPGIKISDPSINQQPATRTNPIKGSYIYLPAALTKFNAVLASLASKGCARIKLFTEEVIRRELTELGNRQAVVGNQLQGGPQLQQMTGIPIDPMLMNLGGPNQATPIDPMLMDLDATGNGGKRPPSTPATHHPSLDRRRIILSDKSTVQMVSSMIRSLALAGMKQGDNKTKVLIEVWDKKVVDAEDGKWDKLLIWEGYLPCA